MSPASPAAAEDVTFAALLDRVRKHVDASLGVWLEAAGRCGERRERRGRRCRRGRARASPCAAASACVPRSSQRRSWPAATRPTADAAAFERVDRAMIAIELLQVYLLIHDDWMDDDDVRRGGPAVHVLLRERLGSKRLGDAAAILAGDLACGYAQEALLESELPAERVLAAARAFARIQEEVVTGQLAEMSTASRASRSSTRSRRRATRSPGPLALGAHLAGASDDARRAARTLRASARHRVPASRRPARRVRRSRARRASRSATTSARASARRSSPRCAAMPPAEALLARVLGRVDASRSRRRRGGARDGDERREGARRGARRRAPRRGACCARRDGACRRARTASAGSPVRCARSGSDRHERFGEQRDDHADRRRSVRGTAHGKVILFGEHAVVYGVPALAVGIDRGAWAQVDASASAKADATRTRRRTRRACFTCAGGT